MIIDMHYHYTPLPTDEYQFAKMVDELLLEAEAGGVKNLLNETIPVYRDYMDDADGNKLVCRMDESGIDITLVCVVDNVDRGFDNHHIMEINRQCASLPVKNPRRIVALAGIDPRRLDAPFLLRQCIEEYKMVGLKLHPDHGYYLNSNETYAVLEVANEFGIPILVHTGPLPGSRAKYSQPIHLDDVAVDFPNINIIAAHMGDICWHEWAAIAKYKKNIYGDLSMWQFMAETNPKLFRRYLREILDIVGPTKVLFGTDGPMYEPLISNKRWLQIVQGLYLENSDGIKFESDEIEAILGENACRVFGLRASN